MVFGGIRACSVVLSSGQPATRPRKPESPKKAEESAGEAASQHCSKQSPQSSPFSRDSSQHSLRVILGFSGFLSPVAGGPDCKGSEHESTIFRVAVPADSHCETNVFDMLHYGDFRQGDVGRYKRVSHFWWESTPVVKGKPTPKETPTRMKAQFPQTISELFVQTVPSFPFHRERPKRDDDN